MKRRVMKLSDGEAQFSIVHDSERCTTTSYALYRHERKLNKDGRWYTSQRLVGRAYSVKACLADLLDIMHNEML